MGKVRDREYGEMYAAYLKVEDKYWEWAALYKEFQRKKAAGYYYTFPKKSKKFDRIKARLEYTGRAFAWVSKCLFSV